MTQVASGGTRLSLDKRAMTRRTGLMLPAAMPLDAWVDVGREIAVIADASAWWLGDWLVYGQDSYPERYKRAIERTGLSYRRCGTTPGSPGASRRPAGGAPFPCSTTRRSRH